MRQSQADTLFCCDKSIWNIYRTFPCKKNKLTDSDFLGEFPDFLEHCFVTSVGSTFIFSDFNFHFDNKCRTSTQEINQMLDAFELCQHITEPKYIKGNILDVVISKKKMIVFC